MSMSWFGTFFQWLLAASLRASLLAVGVFALQAILQRGLPARWRYALWLPMILVLVAPVLPASPWSVENQVTRGLRWCRRRRGWRRNRSRPASQALRAAAIVSLPKQTSVWIAWILGTTVTPAVAGTGYRRVAMHPARSEANQPRGGRGCVRRSRATRAGLSPQDDCFGRRGQPGRCGLRVPEYPARLG